MQIKIKNPNTLKTVALRTNRTKEVVEKDDNTEHEKIRFFLNEYQIKRANKELGTDLINLVKCEKVQRNGAWFVKELPGKQPRELVRQEPRKIEEIEGKLESLFINLKGLEPSAKHYHNLVVEEVARLLKNKYPDLDDEQFIENCSMTDDSNEVSDENTREGESDTTTKQQAASAA